MRITFLFDALILRPDSDEPLLIEDLPSDLQLAEESLADYLPFTLADAGAIGGRAFLHAQRGVRQIHVVYWVPEDFSASQLEQLGQDTIIQMEDGLGEGGFEFDLYGDSYLALTCERKTAVLEICDDGAAVLPASRIAIAAREGNVSALSEGLRVQPSDIDRKLHGYTALQLAITYGHFEAARLLIASGAAVNETCPLGSTTLKHCAGSNRLDDSQSYEIAKLLLAAGAVEPAAENDENSALALARLRKKPQLVGLLEKREE